MRDISIGNNCIPFICASLRLIKLTVAQSDVLLWNLPWRNHVRDSSLLCHLPFDLFNSAQ